MVNVMNMSGRIIISKKDISIFSMKNYQLELTEVLPSGQGSNLICFGTGLIVPKMCYNDGL